MSELVVVVVAVMVIVVVMCIHRHKWGIVQEDGYQYCEGCNKARTDGVIPCKHEWETIKEVRISITRDYTTAMLAAIREGGGGNYLDLLKKKQEPVTTGYLYVMKCKNCGDVNSKEIEI